MALKCRHVHYLDPSPLQLIRNTRACMHYQRTCTITNLCDLRLTCIMAHKINKSHVENFRFTVRRHSYGCSRAWMWLTSSYLNYVEHRATYIHCLPVVHLWRGFMANYYTTVHMILVQGVATTCWHQIQKDIYTTACVLHTFSNILLVSMSAWHGKELVATYAYAHVHYTCTYINCSYYSCCIW